MKEFEGNIEVSDIVPWHDTKKWKKNKYYPLPHTDEAVFENTELWFLGSSWGVYKLADYDSEHALFGDIEPIVAGVHMKDACIIANSLNEKKSK